MITERRSMTSKLSSLFVSLSISLRHLFPLAVECCLNIQGSDKHPPQFTEQTIDASGRKCRCFSLIFQLLKIKKS